MGTIQLDIQQATQEIDVVSEPFRRLLEQMQRVIVSEAARLRRMLVGLLSYDQMLIEGVRGLAKVLVVYDLACGIDTRFGRLQFTPGLLHADPIGKPIFRPTDGAFVVQNGPISANIILAATLNRAPAKVQSALLEAMQDGQVTVGAKVSGFLAGRHFVTPQDVKHVAMPVVRHCIAVTYEAEAEERVPEDVVKTVRDHVPVP